MDATRPRPLPGSRCGALWPSHAPTRSPPAHRLSAVTSASWHAAAGDQGASPCFNCSLRASTDHLCTSTWCPPPGRPRSVCTHTLWVAYLHNVSVRETIVWVSCAPARGILHMSRGRGRMDACATVIYSCQAPRAWWALMGSFQLPVFKLRCTVGVVGCLLRVHEGLRGFQHALARGECHRAALLG